MERGRLGFVPCGSKFFLSLFFFFLLFPYSTILYPLLPHLPSPRLTKPPSVGKFVTATLRHPTQSFGKALKVQSFIVTPKEVLAEFEKQTGSTFDVTETPLPEIQELEEVLWDKKSDNPQPNPQATFVTLRRIWAQGGTLYEKNDNEVLEVKQEDLDTLEEGVRRYLAGGYKAETFGVRACSANL